MTIWIDPPMWPAHGLRWSHLISDSSVEELHDFARRHGIPRRSFEGDHYDVPATRHTDLVAGGARPTTANDLARRLAASGLRFRKRRGEWPLARVSDGLSAVGGPHVLDVVASPHEPPPTSGAAVVLMTLPDRAVVLVRSISREGWAPPGGKRDPLETPREAAVREVTEETGVVLRPGDLAPVGYERISIAPGEQVAPWEAGDNYIGVYGVELAERVGLTTLADDVDAAQWVSADRARILCGGQPWWPLLERWLQRS